MVFCTGYEWNVDWDIMKEYEWWNINWDIMTEYS